MVFSSSIFIFLFMPTVLMLYWAVSLSKKISIQNAVLLLASVVFYAWGGIEYLIVLLCLIGFNYLMAIIIDKYEKIRTFSFVVTIIIDILNLAYFKYYNFIMDNLHNLYMMITKKEWSLEVTAVVLPIGISFYSFQILSYVIDVYKRKVSVQKNPFNLMLYVIMFPQLIAGPIVRYADINDEIIKRTINIKDTDKGIERFIIGFGKKVFLANSMGSIADMAFSQYTTINPLYLWLGAISYSLQIYYDFSAYSDMAIGLGWIFGFHFEENFNYPYISRSIKEFWRRWHISLSSWFRDYVYIPLGGNRKGKMRTYINLAIVFLLTGIWHGAAWQFIIWGIWHGFFLILERIGWGKILDKLPRLLQHIYTLLVVLIGWVFFRADNINCAIVYIKRMFTIDTNNIVNADILLQVNMLTIICFVVAIILCAPIYKKIADKIGNFKVNKLIYLVCFIFTALYMVGLSYNPFIYFKF